MHVNINACRPYACVHERLMTILQILHRATDVMEADGSRFNSPSSLEISHEYFKRNIESEDRTDSLERVEDTGTCDNNREGKDGIGRSNESSTRPLCLACTLNKRVEVSATGT